MVLHVLPLLLLLAAYPHLCHSHNILVVGGSFVAAAHIHFLCHLHSFPGIHHCSLARTHYCNRHSHIRLARTGHIAAGGIVEAEAVVAGILEQAQVAELLSHCMAVEAVGNSLDRMPFCPLCDFVEGGATQELVCARPILIPLSFFLPFTREPCTTLKLKCHLFGRSRSRSCASRGQAESAAEKCLKRIVNPAVQLLRTR